MTRAYTAQEVADLRKVCRQIRIWGTSAPLPWGVTCMSGPYIAREMDAAVEEMVRTYIAGGITAEEIKAADAGKVTT